METVNEIIRLVRRQAELEASMRRPGGIPVIEEHELLLVRQQLAEHPAATDAVLQAAHALGRPVNEVTAREVVNWATLEHNAAHPSDSPRELPAGDPQD